MCVQQEPVGVVQFSHNGKNRAKWNCDWCSFLVRFRHRKKSRLSGLYSSFVMQSQTLLCVELTRLLHFWLGCMHFKVLLDVASCAFICLFSGVYMPICINSAFFHTHTKWGIFIRKTEEGIDWNCLAGNKVEYAEIIYIEYSIPYSYIRTTISRPYILNIINIRPANSSETYDQKKVVKMCSYYGKSL